MIITCERCATRFKVPDDKLAGRPVRMRCSKCNHVFLAEPAAVVAEAGVAPPAPAPLPPSFATTLPPSFLSSSVPAPVSGPVAVFGAARAPSHDPFSALGSPPARIDPFAVITPSAAPSPSRPDPFAGLGVAVSSGHDPFASLGAPGTPAPFMPTSRKVTNDPFAGLGLPVTPPRAASRDPFSGIAPAPVPMPAPFGNVTSSPPAVARPDPFASVPPSPPAPTTQPDPFGTPGMPRSDPFSAASVPDSDPFAAAMSQPRRPMADPFAMMSQPPQQAVDPFAAITSPPTAVSLDPFAEPAVADPFRASRTRTPPPPAPDDEEDPFGRLDDVGASYDADARSSLFGLTAPTPPTTPHGWGGAPAAPSSAPSGLSLATPPPAPLQTPQPRGSRFIPALHAALNVLQVLLFVVFVIVAVVLARGGSPLALLSGDLGGAFESTNDVTLRVDHLDIAWRTGGGGGLLVVTGTIHHGGDAPLPSIVVEVSADGTVIGNGFAWSDIDAFAVASVASAQDVAALQARRPKSPRVAPGDDAPFVIVAPAPDISADVVVIARPGA